LMRRRRFILTAAGAGGAALCSCSPREKRILRWGSASLGSSGYVIMEAFAQTVNRRTSLTNASLATLGAAENLALLESGDLEFAHATSVDIVVASAGAAPYPRPVRCHQMFAYANWRMPPVVHENSKIKSPRDLAGKRYSPSTHGSGAAVLHHTLMQAVGVDDRIRWSYGSWTEAYDAFKMRRLDVVVGVITNGALSTRLIEAEASGKVVPLELSAADMATARAANPGIYFDTVGADVWPSLERPVTVPMTTGILAASPAVTPEEGYEATKAVFSSAAELQKIGLALKNVDLDFAVRNLLSDYPVNAGAAQYFQEAGVWNPALAIAGDART
jgi:TRAP transporter TAXI family solute receptor